MDNDLMARRLRPPSQPNYGNGQASQPQEPSPWDLPLTEEDQFAPTDPRVPDPSARADVPWDRPAAEPWPPAETDLPPTWSAQGGGPDAPQSPAPPAAAAASARPEWPAADPLTQEEAPWDKPAASEATQWRDPDDAFAPVVGDVQGSGGAWDAWNENGNGNANGHSTVNGNGHSSGNDYDVKHAIGGAAVGGGGGIRYIPQSDPEPLTVAAHSDQPTAGDDPHGMGSNPLPEWPAEDDLTVMPSSGRGPVMPEDSWPTTPVTPQPAPTPPAPPAPAAPAAPQQSAPSWPAFDQTSADAAAKPDPEPVVPTPPPPPAAPAPVTPTVEIATPANTQIVAMTPSGTPQNMVLRIELAIVDESRRANPAENAKRVGPDADVRRPEYEPRNTGGSDQMPEPEYVWGAPPVDAQDPGNQLAQDRRQTPDRRRQGQPNQPQQQWPSQQQTHQPQQVSPPPSGWLPAQQQPQYPPSPAWDQPPAAPQYQQPRQPMADPLAPWASPAQPSSPELSPYAPAPTWAMTQPTPPYQPEQPQYIPPPAPQHQQQQYPPAAPPQYPPAAPPQYPPAAPPQYQQSAQQQPYQKPAWPPAVQPAPQPDWPPAARPQHMPQPGQSALAVQSAPAAGSRSRTGQQAADTADLWFLNNTGTVATAADAEAQPEGKSNSLLTAGLTIGFAVLVIVLVLVFIQLMTSLLR